MEQEYDLKSELLEALETKNKAKLREIFDTIPNIDIAKALDDFDDVKSLVFIFKVVSKEYTGDFFTELSSEQQELIIKSFSDKELIELLENSFTDDIVDVAEELPANLVNRILRVSSPDLRKDINLLLNYKDNTAGSLMTTEYIEMRENIMVKEAIEFVRTKGRDAETIYTIFVRDKTRTLVGTVDLDDLIFAKDNEILEEIMNKDFVTCQVNDDQEVVANKFKDYDLNAMAVVNNENKIIGVITIDDIVDIIVEEANEDIAALSQVGKIESPYLKTPVFKLVLKCIPWIIVLMVLQIFSTLILSKFETAIASFALLAVFTPMIMDAGGNSGGQTTTMIVRSISMGEFNKGDFKRVVWKEIRVALCVAGLVSLFALGWLMFEMCVLNIISVQSLVDYLNTLNPPISPIFVSQPYTLTKFILALLVSATLFVTMVVSRMIGSMLPFLAKKIKLDPAVVCGPITTTIVDVISLLTYFLLWTLLFSKIFGI